MHFFHPGKIEQRRAVDAHKTLWIELLLKFSNRVVHNVAFRTRDRVGQLLFRLKVTHAVELDQLNMRAHPRRDALGIFLCRRAIRIGQLFERALQLVLNLCQRSQTAQALYLLERTIQFLRFNRLEQVVDRVGLESLERVLIISGSENNPRLRRQLCEQLEAVHLRHLDVKKQHVHRSTAQKSESRFRVGTLPYDLNPSCGLQQMRETFERKSLVINQIDTQQRTRHHERPA